MVGRLKRLIPGRGAGLYLAGVDRDDDVGLQVVAAQDWSPGYS